MPRSWGGSSEGGLGGVETERELGGRWDLQTRASTAFRMCGGGVFVEDLQMPFGRLDLGAGVSYGISCLFQNSQLSGPLGVGADG